MEIKELEELTDRKSERFRKAYYSNLKEKEETPTDPLALSLSQATHISDSTKEKYLEMANLYLADLANNIFKNQFELNSTYPSVTIDEWNDFLADRIVNTYIQKHKRTLLKAAAEDNLANPLAKNKRDNLQLIKNIEEKEKQESKQNIVILRIPDIYTDTDSTTS